MEVVIRKKRNKTKKATADRNISGGSPDNSRTLTVIIYQIAVNGNKNKIKIN